MDIIKNKGIIIPDDGKDRLDSFIASNCSLYYMINFLRITAGNIDNAISLYFLDENLRAIVLKYILRLEVQMKKDFIDCVYDATQDDSFWKNRVYYNSRFTKPKSGSWKSPFDIAVNEVEDRMRSMHYSSSGDKNHQAFYAMSFGVFLKFYSGMHMRYHYDFTERYAYKDRNSVDILKRYLDSIRMIRNRCCHSNHMISLKLKNSLIFKVPALSGFVGDSNSEFEKTLYFIYSRLDNKESFIKDILKLLRDNESYWKPYCNKHILPISLLEDIKKW